MSNVCNIYINDEVNCILSGLHPDHLGYFYETYGVFAPNYFFNPKFKLGSWDGKIRYFYKTGKTYVNLLEEILPRVIGLGYKIKLVDKRVSDPIDVPLIDKNFLFETADARDEDGEPWIMRGYQVDLVNALISNGGGVGVAGTGAGKTGMTAALALSYEKAADLRSIIIVPDKNLTDQTHSEYLNFGVDVGEYSGENKDLNHKHIVSTWQSLQNNPKIIQDFDMVIVDEAHGLKGQVLTKLLNEYGCDIPYRFGVTGTLPKADTDALSVKIAVGLVQYTKPAHELIEEGYLAKLDISIMQLCPNFHPQHDEYLKETDDEPKLSYLKFKDSYLPDWQAEKKFMQSEQSRLEWISEYTMIKSNSGNVLCLVDGVRFGKKLQKMTPGSIFLSGKDKMKDRKEVFKLFKDNDDLIVFATVQIASTGLDIKRIFEMMSVDAGKSFIRIIQTIGRGLRKAKDKDAVHFTDICSDLKYGKKHLRERIKFYNESKYPHKKTKVDYSL